MTTGVRCMVLRGGSSKGAFFLRDDLPESDAERDDLLRRLMGSPDARQIDGIGGAHPLTSKVAIVATATDGEADLDYLFLQVGVADDVVTDRQNCGNLLAGVGPFGLERGLVAAEPDATSLSVRIRMLNTDTIATARFPVRAGAPDYEGDVAISGVPGTAAAIHLDFDDLAGATTGGLLPTGNPCDTIAGVPCTLIDNGMPVVVMAADALGVSGYETCEALEANAALRAKLEEIRLDAARRMNLGDVTEATIPKLTLVAPPRQGGHLTTRTFIPHRCHEAIGVLGAVSVATAALIDGSPASEVRQGPPGDRVRLEHPSGFFDAAVSLAPAAPTGAVGGEPRTERAGIIRTARKLMDGDVFPRSY